MCFNFNPFIHKALKVVFSDFLKVLQHIKHTLLGGHHKPKDDPRSSKKDNKNGIKNENFEKLKLVKTQTHLILKNFLGGKSPLKHIYVL